MISGGGAGGLTGGGAGAGVGSGVAMGDLLTSANEAAGPGLPAGRANWARVRAVLPPAPALL